MGLVRYIGNLFFPFDRRFLPAPKLGENPQQWLGRQGELMARRYLRQQGYRVLYANFRAPRGGEVDLVCRDLHTATLAFVEVKTRSNLNFGSPAEAVSRDKQHLIARGALAWLQLLGNPDIFYRFDIVEVLVAEEQAEFNLIKDAFKLPEPYLR